MTGSAQASRVSSPSGPIPLLAYAAALVALTGVPLVAPAVPLLQEQYGLSAAEVGWINASFVLPSVFWAIPAGHFADRFGRATVYSASLLVYGAAAAGPLLWDSTAIFFATRLLQGMSFGAILPLTITILGDVIRNSEQVKGQARRNLAMALGDGLFPIIGGGLAALVGWRYPFIVQLVAIPLALLAWPWLRSLNATRPPRGASRPRLSRATVFSSKAVALQVAGFLRFLFKFGLATYVPVLLDRTGASSVMIGFAVGSSALMTIVATLLADTVSRRFEPWLLVGSSLAGIGAIYVLLALPLPVPVYFAGLLAYGFLDGLYGVVQNSVMVRLVPAEIRGSFVAVIGTVRNTGKFAAPVLMGAIIGVWGLGPAFAAVAAIAFAGVGSAWPLRRMSLWEEDASADGRSGG